MYFDLKLWYLKTGGISLLALKHICTPLAPQWWLFQSFLVIRHYQQPWQMISSLRLPTLFLLFIFTVCTVWGAGSMKQLSVRPSVRPSHHSAAACCMLLLQRVCCCESGSRRYRSIATWLALSSKSEQCHVVSWHRKINTDWFRYQQCNFFDLRMFWPLLTVIQLQWLVGLISSMGFPISALW